MYINISDYQEYLVLASKAPNNTLKRYVIKGDVLLSELSKFGRVCFVGQLQGFEIYTKNPDTGESGWEIEWVYGVREMIESYYPNFDCFITQDLSKQTKPFYHTGRPSNDYQLGDL